MTPPTGMEAKGWEVGEVAKVVNWDKETVVVKVGEFPLCRYPKDIEDVAEIFASEVNRALAPFMKDAHRAGAAAGIERAQGIAKDMEYECLEASRKARAAGRENVASHRESDMSTASTICDRIRAIDLDGSGSKG